MWSPAPVAMDGPRSLDYLIQIGRAAEQVGFDAVLTPTGTWCEDAWLVTTAVAQHTTRLRFLVAFRPGITNPTLAAQQAATFQRLTSGRLLINIVTGGDADEQRRFGDQLSHDERYARTDEFLSILRGAWGDRPYDFDGRYYRIEGATVMGPPDPIPEIFFGGASTPAQDVAARHVDVYLCWGEAPAMTKERIDAVRDKAAARGRTVRFGIRLHVITRDTERQAWDETDRLLSTMDDGWVDAVQRHFSQTESVGQQRMTALHGGNHDDLVVSPNLWAGIGLSVRVPAPLSWAVTSRSPSGSTKTTRSASTNSSFPVIRTSRRPAARSRMAGDWARNWSSPG